MKLAAFALLLVLVGATVCTAQNPAKLIAEADAMYWFAQAEGGDMKMLEAGIAALDRADKMLAGMPPGAERERLEASSAALRTELVEQQIMAHDTINGVLPLFRYFVFRDAVSEWVDDPLVITAVRGARSLSEVASKHWMPYPQLDVIYGSSGRETPGDLTSPMTISPTQENEMAYVFNLDGRFFNHHRGEVAAVLGPSSMQNYNDNGIDAATASDLCRAWGIQRLLEVRIKELFVDGPWWFYVVTGRLFSASDGASEATVNSFGMVRDQTAKTPWLLLVFLPFAVAALWAAGLNRAPWVQALVAAATGLLASAAFSIAVGPWIPPGDFLLTISWWAPAGVALALLFVLPMILYAVAWRFRSLATWFFGSDEAAKASGLGLGAGVAALGTFAALTELDVLPAAIVSVLAVPALGCIPARLFAILRGTGDHRRVDVLLSLAAIAWFAWVLWSVPQDDRSPATVMTALLPIVVSAAGLLGLVAVRHAALAGLAIFVIAAFGAMMTGQLMLLAPLAIVGTIALLGKEEAREMRTSKTSDPGRSPADRRGWNEILTNANENWPLAKVGPLDEVKAALRRAVETARHGTVATVSVFGEAGSGKTRMIREAATDGGWRLFQGCCRSGDAFSFLQDAAQQSGAGRLALLGGDEEGKAAMEIGAKLISSVPVLGTFCDWIAPSGYDQSNITPESLAGEFLALIEATGRGKDQPALVWVDEAENLTADGRALLRALADNARTRRQPLVIVLSGRRDENDLPVGERVRTDWQDADRLAALENVLSPPSARSLVQASPGLVIGSYVAWVQHLWHRESLEEDGSKLSIAPGAAGALEVPRSVVEAAGKSLEGIEPEVFEALQAAAVDGTRFHIAAIAGATGLPMFELLRRLETAERWGIVEDLPEDEIFAFKTTPVREYLAATLRHDQKGSYSQRYVTWNRGLAEAYAGFGDHSFLAEAAQHAREAGKTYRAKAVEVCIAAAEFARSRGQWEEAAELAAFAIDHGGTEKAAVAGTIYLKSLWLLRRDPAQEQIAARIVRLRPIVAEVAPSDGGAFLACEIVRTLWPSAWNPRGDATAGQLLERVEPQSEAARIRVLHFRAASLHKFADKSDEERRREALALLREAANLPAGTHEARQERAEALNTLAEVALQLGEEDQVVQALEESISIKKSTGDKQGLAISYGSLGRFHLFRRNRTSDDLQKAIAAFCEDLELSREIGDASGQVSMLSFLGLCHLESGDAARALESFRQSRDAAASLGQKRNEAFAMCGMARAMAATKAPELTSELAKLREMIATLGEHDREALKHAVEKVREACGDAGVRF